MIKVDINDSNLIENLKTVAAIAEKHGLTDEGIQALYDELRGKNDEQGEV